MARTKQTARKSTGGMAPRRMLSIRILPKVIEEETVSLRDSIYLSTTKKRKNFFQGNEQQSGGSFSLLHYLDINGNHSYQNVDFDCKILQSSLEQMERERDRKVKRRRYKANKIVEEISESHSYDSIAVPTVFSNQTINYEMEKLAELYELGFINEKEFKQRRVILDLQNEAFVDECIPTISYSDLFAKNENASNDSNQSNNVRIFISSTFRDMEQERELMMKLCFPKLRRFCEERGIFLTQVDLRWGITESQSQKGETINICLNEVDNCRPYFVCLLGGRYGWHHSKENKVDTVLKKTFETAMTNFPWLEEYTDRSVTELEIRHAVLNDLTSETSKRALFYFKEGSKSDNAQLDALKNELKQKGLNVKHYNLEILASLLYKNLKEMLKKDFPVKEPPTPLQIARMAHQGFQHARARVYIGRKQYFDVLDKHVLRNPSPIIVVGNSGSGKSALVCNWVQKYRERNPNKVLISHYIGCNSESTDLGNMLRRICEELKFSLGITREISSDRNKLVEDFPNWLTEASHRGGAILVLDAINQLELDDVAQVSWIPQSIPKEIVLIVSSLPEKCLSLLKNRGWPTLIVDPLNNTERKTIINTFLSKYSKKLSEEQLNIISDAPQCENALFLRIVLEEIRTFGNYEMLTDRIHYYLQAKNPIELLSKVFKRLENDFDKENTGIIKKILCLIYVSRKGLSEVELLSITKILPVDWSPIHIALSEFLISHSGYFTFFHDYLRQSVEKYYILENHLLYRKMIIEYFTEGMMNISKSRIISEHLYQLNTTQDYSLLSTYISDPYYFELLFSPENQMDFFKYWRNCDDEDVGGSFVFNLGMHYKDDISFLLKCAFFLQEVASYDSCEELYEMILKKVPDSNQLEKARAKAAYAYYRRLKGNYQQSAQLYEEALPVFQKNLKSNDPEMATLINNMAMLYRHQGKYAEAEKYYLIALEKRLQIFGDSHADIAQSYNSLGCLAQDMNRLKESENYLIKALAMRERILGPTHQDVAMTLTNLGGLYFIWCQFEQAEKIFQKALSIYKALFGDKHPGCAQCLNSLAGIKSELSNYEEAQKLYEEAMNIKRKILGQYHPEVALTLNDLAVVYVRTREYSKALPIYEESLLIRKRVFGKNHPDVAQSYNNLGSVKFLEGYYSEAEKLFNKALKIYEDAFGPNHMDVANTLKELAGVYQEQGKYEEAVPLYNKAYECIKQLAGEDNIDIAVILNDFAIAQFNRKNYTEAEQLYLKSLTIHKKIYGNEHPDVGKQLGDIGEFYLSVNEKEKALIYFKESFQLFKKRLDKEKCTALSEKINQIEN